MVYVIVYFLLWGLNVNDQPLFSFLELRAGFCFVLFFPSPFDLFQDYTVSRDEFLQLCIVYHSFSFACHILEYETIHQPSLFDFSDPHNPHDTYPFDSKNLLAFSRIINLPSFYFQLQAFNFNVEFSGLCCLSRVSVPFSLFP